MRIAAGSAGDLQSARLRADSPDVPDWFLVLLVVVGGGYLLAHLPVGPLFRWRLRRRMIAMLDADLPADERARAVATVREAVPLRGRAGPVAPDPFPRRADPTELRVRVTVPPTEDGCPGFRVSLPWHSAPAASPGTDGSRQVVTVLLGGGRALLVVALGRVGRVDAGAVLATAADRPVLGRALGPHVRGTGDVLHARTAAGPAWRHTFEAGTTVVGDTHVDRDGWGFVLGLVRRDGDTAVDGLDDAVLATWEWLDPPRAATVAPTGPTTSATPAGPVPAAPAPDVPGPAGGDAAAPQDVPLADATGRTLARCRLPHAPVAAGVPGAAGAWTSAYVRLSSTASLAVVVAPADPGRAAREALAASRLTAWGPSTVPTGDVRERAVAAGTVATRSWRTGGLACTEARLDRAGRSWRWLLTYAPGETSALAVLEQALQTWGWEPDDPAA